MQAAAYNVPTPICNKSSQTLRSLSLCVCALCSFTTGRTQFYLHSELIRRLPTHG
jgi:hypothetical protein